MNPAPEPTRRQKLVDGPRLLAGIVVASLAAGPVFFIAGALGSSFIVSARAEAFRWAESTDLPVLLLLSVRYVFLSALLPVTLGTAAMVVLGAMFRGARSWLVWILAGIALAGLICLLFSDLVSTYRLHGFALLVTAIACAIICRAFARWPEDADAAGKA